MEMSIKGLMPIPVPTPRSRSHAPRRGAIERWCVVQSLVRRLEMLVSTNAYLDATLADGGRHARLLAARVETEVEELVRRIDAEATRVTVEAAARYLDRAKAKATRTGRETKRR